MINLAAPGSAVAFTHTALKCRGENICNIFNPLSPHHLALQSGSEFSDSRMFKNPQIHQSDQRKKRQEHSHVHALMSVIVEQTSLCCWFWLVCQVAIALCKKRKNIWIQAFWHLSHWTFKILTFSSPLCRHKSVHTHSHRHTTYMLVEI